MRCPQCNTENVDSAKFCNECGQPLAPEVDSLLDVARDLFPDKKTSLKDAVPEVSAGDEPLSAQKTADLTGLEMLVDSSYVPPAQGARTGSTMEMPRIEVEGAPSSTSFIASQDPREAKRQQKEQKKLEKRQAREEKKCLKETGVKKDPSDMTEEELAARRRKRIALAVCAGVLIVSAVAVAATYYMELWGGKVVPDVVGQSKANAAYVLEEKGFATESMEVKSDEVQGIVLLTDPAAGRRAPEGSTVVMHISVARTVPEVVGLTEEEARQLMDAEGFTNVEYKLVKSNEEEGRVLSVSPEAGTESKSAAAIVVEVAQAYTVPNVEGLTWDEAEAALEAEGYVVSIVWHYDEELEEGMAYATDPAAGTKLNSGLDVTLYVTKKRSSVLVDETYAYLRSSGAFSIDGVSYEVSSIDSVKYLGDDRVSYTLTARPYETYYWFGSIPDTRYGESQKVSGEIQWNSSNSIESTVPSIKKL